METYTDICEIGISETGEYDSPSTSSASNIKLTLSESLGVVAIKYSVRFQEYKLLAEWLGCYTYRLPAERILSTNLIFQVAKGSVKTPTDCFKIWLASDILFTCYDLNSQERMNSWIRDYNYYPIPHCLHYMPAPESSNYIG